jgi:hypothetical protein
MFFVHFLSTSLKGAWSMKAKLFGSMVFVVVAGAAMSARAVVITDTFDGPTLNPMWTLDDEAASYSGGGFTIPGDGIARFNNVGNYAYAHIETATPIDTTGGIRADAIMRQDHYPVSTWGMSITIYYDADNWVSLKQGAAGGQSGWLRYGFDNGNTFYTTSSSVTSDLRTYFINGGVELTPTQIKFYTSTPGVDQYGVTTAAPNLIADLTMARPAGFTGNALVIIGKGYTDPPGYPNPDLDNSIASDNFAFAGIDFARIEYVPEPAAVSLLGISGLALMRRRRGDR